jgi:hypothetical protein
MCDRCRKCWFAFFASGLAVLILCQAGCLKSTARTTVSGKVTFQGKPVPAGTVSFFATDKRTSLAVINADGTYSMGDAPVGDVTITVQTPPRGMAGRLSGTTKPPPGMKMPEEMIPKDQPAIVTDPSKWVELPKKYADVQSSPLKYTVKAGPQEHDIELTP